MYNRVYLIIAGAILIGAPILVNMVSNFVPVEDQDQPSQAAQAPVPSPAAAAPPVAAPPPPPAETSDLQSPLSADPAINAEPAFDAQGIAPEIITAEGLAGEEPPPPVAEHEAQAQRRYEPQPAGSGQ
jgi:hypothetical protein